MAAKAVASLPDYVLTPKIIGARHFIADLTLPFGRVLHDYLA